MNEKWEEGYAAFEAGEGSDANPYSDQGAFGEDFMDWQTGWECAEADSD